ncbi:hypothetical protein SLA2020_237850 [Shorea laevis]
MSRVYVGKLDPEVSERDLEDEFRAFGVLRSVWLLEDQQDMHLLSLTVVGMLLMPFVSWMVSTVCGPPFLYTSLIPWA